MSNKNSAFIYEQIKNDIITSVYKPNQRIAEDELAGRYGISRTPVREAIRMLEQAGFVTCVKNVGTFVRHISASEIGDFFDVRGALEGLNARLAALRAEPGLCDELKEIASAVVAAHKMRDHEAANLLDTKLHDRITAAAKNEFAAKCLDMLGDKLMWFLSISNISRIDYLDSIPFENMKNGHELIIASIADGDPAAAEANARAHVEEAKRYFIDYCYNRFML